MLVPQAKCTKKKQINHQNENVVYLRSTLHYLTSFNVNIIIGDVGIPYKGYQGNYTHGARLHSCDYRLSVPKRDHVSPSQIKLIVMHLLRNVTACLSN